MTDFNEKMLPIYEYMYMCVCVCVTEHAISGNPIRQPGIISTN